MDKEMAAMNIDNFKNSFFETTQQKKVLLNVVAGLTLSNIVLIIALLSKAEQYILIPEFNIDHRLSVAGGEFNDQYFIDWADGIIKTALCVNPDSVDWRHNELLKISTHSYGQMKRVLKEQAENIRKNSLSTVFYPKTFKVDQNNKSIRIEGQHYAFIGKDNRPVIQDKIYEIFWIIGTHGLVLLKDMVEIKGGSNDQ